MKVEVGAYYEHFKGAFYKVVAIATHSETREPMVVYESANEETWVRPLSMWFDIIERGDYEGPRFKLWKPKCGSQVGHMANMREYGSCGGCNE